MRYANACCGAALLLALSGCGGNSATAPRASSGNETATQIVAATIQREGLLTQKGPELGAWWALATDDGQLWRLEPANDKQAEDFRRWQNRRIVVEGRRDGDYLQTPRIRVERAEAR